MQECECKLKRNITKALMKAQEEFDTVEANHTNPHFKSKYAKLVDLYNACKKALRSQNIVISHKCDTHPITNQQVTKTILTHTESGETLDDVRFLVPEKPGSQGHGAAETYMKRYALKSLLGTDVGEDDDDGYAERAYLLQVDELLNHINSLSNPEEIIDSLCNEFRIQSVTQIGSYRMFDALMFIWRFCVNRSKANLRINKE